MIKNVSLIPHSTNPYYHSWTQELGQKAGESPDGAIVAQKEVIKMALTWLQLMQV